MTIANIDSLPNEILVIILKVVEDAEEPLMPLLLVCKLWKQTVQGSSLVYRENAIYYKKLKEAGQWKNYRAMRWGCIHMAEDLWELYAHKKVPDTIKGVYLDWKAFSRKKVQLLSGSSNSSS